MRVRIHVIFYILILCYLTSCSVLFYRLNKERVPYNGAKIEKEFIQHVETFSIRCHKKVDFDMYFAVMPPPIAGMCDFSFFPSRYKYIEIDYSFWFTADHWQREVLIAHELGHCVMNIIGHNNKVVKTEGYERPASIMHKNVLDSYDYYANRDYYLKELCD